MMELQPPPIPGRAASPVPILKTKNSGGFLSRTHKWLAWLQTVRIGLLFPNAPSTCPSLKSPILIGSKNLVAAEVALAASHIFTFPTGSWVDPSNLKLLKMANDPSL